MKSLLSTAARLIKRTFIVAGALFFAALGLAVVGSNMVPAPQVEAKRAAGPVKPALKPEAPKAAAARDECNDADKAQFAVELAFYMAIDASQPGLRYEKPGLMRALNYSSRRDPLRYATREKGECTWRVRSFVTLADGVTTLKYSARARWVRDRQDWYTDDLQIAR